MGEYVNGKPTQQRANGGKVRNVRRNTSDPKQGKYGQVWQFRDGKDWKNFEVQANNTINRQIAEGKDGFTIDQNGKLYSTVSDADHGTGAIIVKIDLKNNKQISVQTNKV